jgi:YidC/Oxa1 family membrane protein insertase
MSNRGPSLTKLELSKYRERPSEKDPEPPLVSLVTPDQTGVEQQARIEWKLGTIQPPELDWQETDDGLALAGSDPSGLSTRVRVRPRADAYALDYELEVENRTGAPVPVKTTVVISLKQHAEKKSGWFAPPAGQMFGLCYVEDKVERLKPDDLKPDEDGPYTSESPVAWGGIDRQYFVVAVLPSQPNHGNCEVSVVDQVVTLRFSYDLDAVKAGDTWKHAFTLYVGPKRDENLAEVSPQLTEVVDYDYIGIPLGVLARPMIFLLNTFHAWTTSWGVAIMILTLLVKLLLFPVTYKSMVSMRRMQLLRPELDKIKKKFEGDRERQQLEQMKLFKEKGVNPLGGCLPMLLQMPIWVALYRTLWSSVDLYQQSFLWLGDLTAKEPYPVMAVLVGGLMFLQQRMSPTSVDSQQAKIMMYGMPVMFTVFMLQMPSGLVLYILTNSVLTLFQTLVINKRTISQ